MSEEKTEQPSAKRLRDARQKGQVAKSQEVPSAAVVLSAALYFIVRGPDIMIILEETAKVVWGIAWQNWDEAWPMAVSATGQCFLNILGPLIPLVIAVSLMSNLAQVGFLFSAEAAKPKLDNLSPARWFKKTFSKNNLYELIKNIFKVAVISAVVWNILKNAWADLFSIPRGNAHSVAVIIGSIIGELVLKSAAAFAALAALDFVYQRFKYTKENMMSKEEVKREYKESEGDPHIKSKRRQLQQEMATQGAVGGVARAKVLVTNPTHYAVALDYEEGKTPLPVICAKGEGETARRMIAEARRLRIPIMREVNLARELYETGVEFCFIPLDLIEPVAEILRWLKTLERAG
jgi:type III secretion protein U